MSDRESYTAELDRAAKNQDTERPGDSSGSVKTTGVDQVPSQVAQTDQEALMERLESRIGDDSGSGNLGQGVHVGTPAGGVTQAAQTGSAHWGSPRTTDQEAAEEE